MKPAYPLVEVTWIDAVSTMGWRLAPMTEPTTCWTAGYLVAKNKKSVVVALCAATADAVFPFGDTITIPIGCVKKIRRLK